MRFSAIALIVLTAACASTPPVDVATARNSWHGATYDQVVARWGTPVRSTKTTDGRDVYTWTSETVASRASFWPSLGIFGGSGGIGLGTGVTMGPGAGEWQRCERTLFFQNGRVVDQMWQGPREYCSQFGRV
jgi:hypothetical protein